MSCLGEPFSSQLLTWMNLIVLLLSVTILFVSSCCVLGSDILEVIFTWSKIALRHAWHNERRQSDSSRKHRATRSTVLSIWSFHSLRSRAGTSCSWKIRIGGYDCAQVPIDPKILVRKYFVQSRIYCWTYVVSQYSSGWVRWLLTCFLFSLLLFFSCRVIMWFKRTDLQKPLFWPTSDWHMISCIFVNT